MDYLHHLQWPAMIVTVVAAWLVASQAKRRRKIGFWVVPRLSLCSDRGYPCHVMGRRGSGVYEQ